MTRTLSLAAVCVTTALVATSAQAQGTDIGPPPGRLIDVGGRSLHFICSGTGSPTVVLEAGASAFAIDWSLVQTEIARRTRVCSYDRAGSGWSQPRNDVDTPSRIVRDLHVALPAAGERPPYVMVGASMGGVYVRLYQLEYPSDVVGLVFVDPSTEDGLFVMYQGKGVEIASLTAAQLLTTMPTGPLQVPRRSAQTGAPFDRLPRQLYELRVKLEQRLIDSIPPSVPADVVREVNEGNRAALARLRDSRTAVDAPIAGVPLVVLTRGDGPAANHAALAKLSPRGRHAVVAGAAHEIHLSTPAAVIQAINDVIDATARSAGEK